MSKETKSWNTRHNANMMWLWWHHEYVDLGVAVPQWSNHIVGLDLVWSLNFGFRWLNLLLNINLKKVAMLVVQHAATKTLQMLKTCSQSNNLTGERTWSEWEARYFRLNWRKRLECVDKQKPWRCEAMKSLWINYREEMCKSMCRNRGKASVSLPNIELTEEVCVD